MKWRGLVEYRLAYYTTYPSPRDTLNPVLCKDLAALLDNQSDVPS